MDELKNENLQRLSQNIRPEHMNESIHFQEPNELDITAIKESNANFQSKILEIKQEVKKEVVMQPKGMSLQPVQKK